MMDMELERSKYDNFVYIKKGGNNNVIIYLLLYDDDILIA